MSVGSQRYRDGDREGAVEFRLHTAGSILGALVMFSADRATELLRIWRDYARELPDGLTTLFAFNRHGPASLCGLNQNIKLHAFGSR